MPKKLKKIFFFDTVLDIEKFVKENPGHGTLMPEDSLSIATSPVVRSDLAKNGISAESTLPYFGDGSRIAAFEKSKILMEWIEKRVNFSDPDLGVGEAYKDWFLFLIRFSINYCLWIIEIITSATEMHRPGTLYASSLGRKTTSSVYIEPEERYLGYFTRSVAQAQNLNYEDFLKKEIPGGNSLLISMKLHAGDAAKFLLRFAKFKMSEKMTLVKKAFGNKREVILFTTKMYGMDSLARDLKAKMPNASFYYLGGPYVPAFNVPDLLFNLLWKRRSQTIGTQKNVFANLDRAMREEEEMFSHKGIPFGWVISRKVRDNIAHYTVGQFLWTATLDQFIDRLQPSAIVTNGNRVDDLILAELCRKREIPSVFISHGSFVKPKDDYERIEWGEHGRLFLRGPFPLYALQSPLAEGYLEQFPSRARLVKTGPLIWGTPVNLEKSELLFESMFGGKHNFEDIKVVLHAGTPKSSNILRFHIYETPDEYIRSISDLARVVSAMADTVLVIRFRPTAEINTEALKRLIPFSEKVVLSIDEPFRDVLGMSGLLVSFSSTTIEEALQNRIPVLLYGGNGRYRHVSACDAGKNGKIEPSAVYHARETKDLEYVIRGIFDLKKGQVNERRLFEPYIYPENIRTPLDELLKTEFDKRKVYK
ncbi:MAG: hypothetical protein ABID09_04410 [Candidatus Omnitrophota bacterium]